jgi:hypothetical protein
MGKKSAVFAVIALFVVLSAAVPPAICKDYVVMISRNINIRTGPGTDRFIVGRAWKGDIFECTGEIGSWYEILMSSGDYRYVSKTWSAKLTEPDILPGHRMRLPASDDSLRALHRDILHAKERAAREADEIIPASVDYERNLVYRRILEDRHIMEVMGMYRVQPALYQEMVKAVARND